MLRCEQPVCFCAWNACYACHCLSCRLPTWLVLKRACPTSSPFIRPCYLYYLLLKSPAMNQNPLVIAHAQIVEYAHNDIHASQATMDTAERRAYERLLRKLLKLPNRPAVILLHTYSYREVRCTC